MINSICINAELAFLDDAVIYLETGYNEFINSYIRRNYSPIQKLLAQKEITFIYLPKAFELPASDHFLKEYISYHYPGNPTEFVTEFLAVQNQLAAGNHFLFLVDILRKQQITGCGLLYKRVSKIYPDSYVFYWFPLDEKWSLKDQFLYFINYRAYYDGPNIESLGSIEIPDDTVDWNFEDEANILVNDVIMKIDYLKSKKEYAFLAEIALRMFDDNQFALQEYLERSGKTIEIKTVVSPSLSRLRIEWTSKFDFDIILPDYGNMVVDMPQLPKALYYFFIQHPEGVMLNSLCDYKAELLYIYRRVSNKTDDFEIFQNIERLTDPLDNSVNVNCSRIKSAFVRLIDDKIASNYYITGRRGSPKGIKLAPHLIEIIK